MTMLLKQVQNYSEKERNLDTPAIDKSIGKKGDIVVEVPRSLESTIGQQYRSITGSPKPTEADAAIFNLLNDMDTLGRRFSR